VASPAGLAWPGSDVAATVDATTTVDADADGVTNVFSASTDQGRGTFPDL
jgi:hypothetical protein